MKPYGVPRDYSAVGYLRSRIPVRLFKKIARREAKQQVKDGVLEYQQEVEDELERVLFDNEWMEWSEWI